MRLLYGTASVWLSMLLHLVVYDGCKSNEKYVRQEAYLYLHRKMNQAYCRPNTGRLSKDPRTYIKTLMYTILASQKHRALVKIREEEQQHDGLDAEKLEEFFKQVCQPTGFTKANIISVRDECLASLKSEQHADPEYLDTFLKQTIFISKNLKWLLEYHIEWQDNVIPEKISRDRLNQELIKLYDAYEKNVTENRWPALDYKVKSAVRVLLWLTVIMSFDNSTENPIRRFAAKNNQPPDLCKPEPIIKDSTPQPPLQTPVTELTKYNAVTTPLPPPKPRNDSKWNIRCLLTCAGVLSLVVLGYWWIYINWTQTSTTLSFTTTFTTTTIASKEVTFSWLWIAIAVLILSAAGIFFYWRWKSQKEKKVAKDAETVSSVATSLAPSTDHRSNQVGSSAFKYSPSSPKIVKWKNRFAKKSIQKVSKRFSPAGTKQKTTPKITSPSWQGHHSSLASPNTSAFPRSKVITTKLTTSAFSSQLKQQSSEMSKLKSLVQSSGQSSK